MKFVYYGLGALLGLLGALSVLRSVELLLLGGSFFLQSLIALGLLLMAGASVKKARSVSK
jgi:hypothetical protein